MRWKEASRHGKCKYSIGRKAQRHTRLQDQLEILKQADADRVMDRGIASAWCWSAWQNERYHSVISLDYELEGKVSHTPHRQDDESESEHCWENGLAKLMGYLEAHTLAEKARQQIAKTHQDRISLHCKSSSSTSLPSIRVRVLFADALTAYFPIAKSAGYRPPFWQASPSSHTCWLSAPTHCRC